MRILDKYHHYKARTERFIKELIQGNRLSAIHTVKKYGVFRKVGTLSVYIFNTLLTGYFIHYTLTNFNYISLGIASALSMYYIDWFVKTVKKKDDDDSIVQKK